MTSPASAAGPRETDRPIVVVGGGYAGVHADREIRRRRAHSVVVDTTGDHDFVTRLAAVAGGTAPVDDASVPLADLGAEVVVGTVTDVADDAVTLADGSTVEAAAVIVTTGASPARPPIDGIDSAAVLRTAQDALALRVDLADRDQVVVIGAGATGVQLAAALSAARSDVAVTIVEAGERLLPAMSPRISSNAARILRSRGVELVLSTSVDSIDDEGVDAGRSRLSGRPVWAGGDRPRGTFGLPGDDDGAIRVGSDLAVAERSAVFAAGDVVRHVDAAGTPLPPSAQVATQAGAVAGANAARLVSGRPTRPADLAHQGWVLDLGGRRGVADLVGIPLADPIADLIPPFLHTAIDTKHLLEVGGIEQVLRRAVGW
ncbi:MAG: FAD-dependent oxidoreductase [Actinomycetota bacterium]